MKKKRIFAILAIIIIIVILLLLKCCSRKEEKLEIIPESNIEEKTDDPIEDASEITPEIKIPQVIKPNKNTSKKETIKVIEGASYNTTFNIYSYDGKVLIKSYNTNIEFDKNVIEINLKSLLNDINYDIRKILFNNNIKAIDSKLERSEFKKENVLDIYIIESYDITIKTNIKSYIDTISKTDTIKVKETEAFVDLSSYIGNYELISILVNGEINDIENAILLSKLNSNINNQIEINVYNDEYDYLKDEEITEPEVIEAASYNATFNIYSSKDSSLIKKYDTNIEFSENVLDIELSSLLEDIDYDIDKVLVNGNRKSTNSKLNRSELNDETNNIDIYVISYYNVSIITNIRNYYETTSKTDKIKVKEDELYINLNTYIGNYELENIIINNVESDTKTLVVTSRLDNNVENRIEINVYDNEYDYLLEEETYSFNLFFDVQNMKDRLGYVLERSYTFNKGQTKIDITSDILARNPSGYSDIKEDFSDYVLTKSVVNNIDANIISPSHFISFENGRFYLIRSHLVGKEDYVNTCDIGLLENYNYKVRFNINVLNNPDLNEVIEKDLHFDYSNVKGYALDELIGKNDYQLIKIVINNKDYFIYEGWRDYSLYDNYNYKSFNKNKTINTVDITYLDPDTINIDTGVSIRVYHKGEEIEYYNFGIQSLLGEDNNYDIYSYVAQKINPRYYDFKSMTINYEDEVECNDYSFYYDKFLDRDTNHIEIHLEKKIYDINYVINYTLFDKVNTKTGTFSYNPSDYGNINYLDFSNIKNIDDYILDSIIVNGEKVDSSLNIDYSNLNFDKENTIVINCHLNTIYNFKVSVYLDNLTDQYIDVYSKNNVVFKKGINYTFEELLDFLGVPVEYELDGKIRFNSNDYNLGSVIDLNELKSIDQVEYNSITLHCKTNKYDVYDLDVNFKVLDSIGNEIDSKELNVRGFKTNKDNINIDIYTLINENSFDNMDSYIVKELIINGENIEPNDNAYNIYTKYLNKDSINDITYILQEKVNTYNINLEFNLGNYYLNKKLNKNIEVTLTGDEKVIQIDKLIKDNFDKSGLILELVIVNGEKINCSNNLPREALNKEINEVTIYMTDNITSKTPSYNAYYEMNLKTRDQINYQDLDGTNWINYIDDTQLVRNMSIPGSYESGSFAVYKEIKKIAGIITQAQSNVIKVQFQYGIRAFDITISPDEGGFISINGIPTSQLLSTVLIDLVDCLNDHPGEFAIVNIKHDLDHIYAYETALDTELELFKYYLINNYDEEYANSIFKTITNNITVGELRNHIGVIFRDDVSPYISNKYNAIVYNNFGKNTIGSLTDKDGNTMKIVVQDDYNPNDYFVKVNEVNKLLNYKARNVDSWVFNNAGGYTVWGLTDFVDLAKEVNINIEGRPSYILQHSVGNYGVIYMNYAGADTVFILGYQMVDAFGNTMCNTIWQHNFFQDSTEKYYTTNIMDLDVSDWDIDDLIDWFLI